MTGTLSCIITLLLIITNAKETSTGPPAMPSRVTGPPAPNIKVHRYGLVLRYGSVRAKGGYKHNLVTTQCAYGPISTIRPAGDDTWYVSN